MIYDKYITTTLPYANSEPHMGHALEFIQADCLNKYFRDVAKENTFFNIGVDEHGLKIFNKAQEEGIDVQKFLDNLTLKWTDFCQKFEIGADNFYRTSRQSHELLVTETWHQFLENGDLYKKKYKAKYCIGCESFKTPSDLIEGKCSDHGTEPVDVEEENYFFKVTKYKDHLLNWLSNNKDFLKPSSKYEELYNIILNAEDVSVSRLAKNVKWGIPVPGNDYERDEPQIIYVWWEALQSYLYALPNFNEQKQFIQLCGPDNLRFQGSLFQAMLAADNCKQTDKLLVHGTVLDKEGKKMSKTMGNVVSPIDQYEKYGIDAVRYYTLAGLTTYGNSSWSEEDLVNLYNNDLADNFGNLVARVLHLIDLYKVGTEIDSESEFLKTSYKSIDEAHELWKDFEINQALRKTYNIIKNANKYINDEKPWSKESTNRDSVLNEIYIVLTRVSELYEPVLSADTYAKIIIALFSRRKAILFDKLELKKS